MRCVTRGFSAFLTGFAILALTPVVALAAGHCARPAERTALELRVLQSELLVAALTCDYQTDYNAFVNRFQPVLSKEGGVLKHYFRRSYGAAAMTSLDKFVTQLANAASQLSRDQGQKFCADMHNAFATLSGTSVDGLVPFAAAWPRADEHGQSLCKGTVVAEADTGVEENADEEIKVASNAQSFALNGETRSDWYFWQ